MAKGDPYRWKRGLPLGKYYPGMERDYEVAWYLVGVKWHRRRDPVQLAEYDAWKAKAPPLPSEGR